MAAVGVQLSGSQLHGLAEHHTEGDTPDGEVRCHAQRSPHEVAVLYKSLRGQFGVERPQGVLALGTAAKYDARCPAGTGDLHAFAYALQESLLGVGLHDAGHPDNRYPAFNTQAGVEGAARQLRSASDADGDDVIARYVVPQHLSRAAVDGSFARRVVEAGQREASHSLAAPDFEVVGGLQAGLHLRAVGHVGVVAGVLDAEGIVAGIAHGYTNGLAVGQADGNFRRGSTRLQAAEGSHGSSGGAGARGQSAPEGEEVGQQLLHHAAEAMGAVDKAPLQLGCVSTCHVFRGIEALPPWGELEGGLKLEGGFDDKDLDARRLRGLHLFHETTADAAFLGEDGFRA